MTIWTQRKVGKRQCIYIPKNANYDGPGSVRIDISEARYYLLLPFCKNICGRLEGQRWKHRRRLEFGYIPVWEGNADLSATRIRFFEHYDEKLDRSLPYSD